MTRIAHCCCGSLARRRPASRRLWARVIAWSANGVPARPLASAPISRKSRCAPRGRARSTCAAATWAKDRNSFLPRLRLLGVLVRGIRPGPCRHRLWRVRRPVDALADAIRVGDDAAFLGDLRSPTRSVYAPAENRRPRPGAAEPLSVANDEVYTVRVEIQPMSDQIERTLRSFAADNCPGVSRSRARTGYAAATAIWAKPVGPMPRTVVHCRTTEDVQLAIRTARDCGVPLSVRGGGHHWACLALCAGMVIDLSGMNGVSVAADHRSAIISGGARAADVARSDGSASRRGRDGHLQRRRHGRSHAGRPRPAIGRPLRLGTRQSTGRSGRAR